MKDTIYEDMARHSVDEGHHYVTMITDMAEHKLVVAGEDIYAANNNKLISKGTVIGSGLRNGLLKHKLLKSIDQSLVIANGVTAESLAQDAAHLAEEDQRFLHLLSYSGDPVEMYEQIARLQLTTQMAFKLTVAKEQRPSLYCHLLLVTLIAQYLARGNGLAEKELNCLLYAALLHDVGEMHVDPAVLNSTRPLVDSERHYIYAHPIIGYLIVLEMSGLDHAVSTAILQHQERLDGSGYPSGLRGAQIGILARILSISDVCASILARTGSNERLSNLMRLNNQKYDSKLISSLYRGFGHLNTEVDSEEVIALPQLSAVAKLMEKWGTFCSTISADGRNDRPEDLEFLFERMANLRSLLLQVGFDPASLPQLIELASSDPKLAKEITEAFCELNWQFEDLEREFIRRGKIYTHPALSFNENTLLSDWIQELHAYLH